MSERDDHIFLLQMQMEKGRQEEIRWLRAMDFRSFTAEIEILVAVAMGPQPVDVLSPDWEKHRKDLMSLYDGNFVFKQRVQSITAMLVQMIDARYEER